MKKTIYLFVSCCLLLNLSACTASSDRLSLQDRHEQARAETSLLKNDHRQSAATIARLEQQLSELKNNPPDAGKLAAMEQELIKLKAQVAQLNEIVKNQLMFAQNSLETTPKQRKGSAQLPLTQEKPGYAIQFFSLQDKTLLESSWHKLAKKYPQVLQGLMPVYQAIRIKNKIFYRVKAGEFKSAAAAVKACSQLKKLGGSCIQSNYKGVRF